MLARGVERSPYKKAQDDDHEQGGHSVDHSYYARDETQDTGSSKASEAARFRNAVVMTTCYVTAAICFGCVVWYTKGQQAGFEFFAGYLVEQSLSVDNLFVFLMLFNYFQVPLEYQGRVLTWGILGAVCMRGGMIVAGVAAVQRFRVVILFFAAILLVSAVKLFFESDEAEELSHNFVMRVSKRLTGATDEYDGDKFFTKVDGRTRATPLLLCLVCIELSDFVFAVDSIPAVIGVSQDLLVVYSSNVFAIMGLRSLYTIVARAVQDLPYLRPAVALVLAFIGLKMIFEYFHYHIPIGISLSIVFALLFGGIFLSICLKSKEKACQGSGGSSGESSSSAFPVLDLHHHHNASSHSEHNNTTTNPRCHAQPHNNSSGRDSRTVAATPTPAPPALPATKEMSLSMPTTWFSWVALSGKEKSDDNHHQHRRLATQTLEGSAAASLPHALL